MYIYRPTIRPPGYATVPNGWRYVEVPLEIAARRRDLPVSRYRYGLIGYDHRLDRPDEERFALEYLGSREGGVRTHGDQAYRNLEGLAEALRAANPEQTYTVDDGAIWLRGEQREWGIYSLYLGSDIPVCCVVDGQTVLHRPAGGAA